MDPLSALDIDSLRASQAEREAADDEVGQTNFLEMLVAQLENQDPLNPQDSAEFAAQLAQFSTVEQLIAVRSGVDELVSLSRAGEGAGTSGGASAIDPSNLVGREVVVYGSQVEVDAARNPITMDFRTIEAAFEGTVTLRDEAGKVVATSSFSALDPTTGQQPLRAGDHTFRLDPVQENMPPGVYAIDFAAKNANGEDVTILPMMTGTVTGAILTGEPSIRMGSKIFLVDDILEVKVAKAVP